MIHHFRDRWGIDRDLYQESMQRNIDYLRNILAHHQEDFIQRLRRGNMIEKLAWKDQEALGFFKVEPSGFSSPYR